METEYQPEDGELILACSHVMMWWHDAAKTAPGGLHWYMLDQLEDGSPAWMEFRKIHGTTGEAIESRARWACLCEYCHSEVNSPRDLERLLAGDFQWDADSGIRLQKVVVN